MQNLISLDNKKVLITGASGGIGRSIAVQCAQHGAGVYLTARDINNLEKTKSLLKGTGHHTIAADLKQDKDIREIAQKLPEIDGLVLNAGILKTIPVKLVKREQVQDVFNVNIIGNILLIQQLLKLRKIKHGASICFISSIAANYVNLGNAIYSATKGAVNSFTKSLALEMAYNKTRVNAILPGYVETDILKKSPISEDQLDEHRKNFPLGRFGKPDDIASLAVYLLSDASEWMTGSLITIDGGYSIK